MVLCLVTLTDLQTRRAGLSATAELLVVIRDCLQHAQHGPAVERDRVMYHNCDISL